MKLVFMKRNALETLKSNLPQIYPKYFFLNEVTNYWMTEVCGENPFQKFEEVEDFSLVSFNKNLTLGEIDFQNCKIVYSNLKFLTEAQAADERFWAGLAHENFYDYLRRRWNMDDITKADKDIVKQIRGRFFSTAEHGVLLLITLLQNIGGSANFFMMKQGKILLKN